MKEKSARITRAGYIISKATNPCILSVLVLILMAATKATNTRLMISWIITLLLFLILLPLLYVFVRRYKTGNSLKLTADPTNFLKQHPRDILIIGLLFGIPGQISLLLFEAPSIIVQTYAALLIGSLVIALCNIFYRVSYHLGAMTILAIMSSFAWGQSFIVLLAALPLIAWAKHRISEHTVPQLLSGIIIAAFTSGGVLLLFN